MPVSTSVHPLPPDAATHRYSVPIVYQDVSPSEALLQAFDNLKHLDHIMNDIFDRISKRVRDERVSISSISQRLEKAAAAISQIAASTTRVTTIYSTAKYPAPQQLPDFRLPCPPPRSSLDNNSPGAGMNTSNSNSNSNSGGNYEHCYDLFSNPHRHSSHQLPLHKKHTVPMPTDTASLFTQLSKSTIVRADAQRISLADTASSSLNKVRRSSAVNEDLEVAEGLGRLPAYLPSVTSILLFNTDENPYKSYVSINNLEGVVGEDRRQQQQGPSAAPTSVMDDLPMFEGFQYDYKPLLGELPSFNLPTNLPLGRLADISYTNSEQLSIAPSNAPLLQLPTLSMLALPDVSSMHRKEKLSAVPNMASSSSSSAPPPPPAPSAPTAPSSGVVVADNVPPPPGPPPPPTAPPMAPPMDGPPPPPPGPPAPSAPKPAAAAEGGRSALLDAIRNNNMSRLRKTSANTAPASAAPKKGGGGGAKKAAPPPDDGGDIMTALRNRLAARQHAISGKNQDDVVSGAAKPAAAATKLAVPRMGQSKKSSDESDGGAEGGKEEQGDESASSNKLSFAEVAKRMMEDHKQEKDNDNDEWA